MEIKQSEKPKPRTRSDSLDSPRTRTRSRSRSRGNSVGRSNDIRWEVVTKRLRVRATPSGTGEKVPPSLARGAVVIQVSRRGNWLKHEQGWSMLTDGKGDGGVTFLKQIKERKKIYLKVTKIT